MAEPDTNRVEQTHFQRHKLLIKVTGVCVGGGGDLFSLYLLFLYCYHIMT